MGGADAEAVKLQRDVFQTKARGVLALDEDIGELCPDFFGRIGGRIVANREERPRDDGVGVVGAGSVETGSTDLDGLGIGVFCDGEGRSVASEGGNGQGSAEKECEKQGQENTGCFHDSNLQFLRYM